MPEPAPAAGETDKAGLRKAAVLLISLEQEMASTVLAQMDRSLVEAVTVEIARLEEVTREERDKVLTEFHDLCVAQAMVDQGGSATAKELLLKAGRPEEEVQEILELLGQAKKAAPFSFLNKAESGNLLAFLQSEHPQTIALILAHIQAAKASEILAGLPAKKQLDVVKRLATMENTSPEVVKEVEKALEKKLSAVISSEGHELGGVEAVANMLNLTDRATERGILESLEEENPELVDQIRRHMFVFEDILRVDDRGVQNIMKEIDNEQLALALKTATPELKDKFLRNMSKRASEMIREEMEYMGPVRLADVEAAQQAIVDVVRRLEEQGDVIIEGRGEAQQVIT